MTTLAIYFGLAIELMGLALVPLVFLRRKEPSSTAAWILALVFLPAVGAFLFLMFGRERVRLPVQWKRDADRALAMALAVRQRSGNALLTPPPSVRLMLADVDRDLFRVATALTGAEPSEGNSVELLVDGEETYRAIGEAIDQARDRVWAEYYLVRCDATADWFRDRLVAAARRGVEVKLLVDGYGSFWLQQRWLSSLRKAGVEVAFFLPARLVFLQPMNLRNHRKIVVVDGELAFTGGINIGDEYRGLLGPWRDTHLALRGPAVGPLEAIFVQDWHFATRHDPSRHAGAHQAAGEARGDAEAQAATASATAPPAGDAHVAVIRSGPDVTGPAREAIHRVFFSAITLAQRRVLITTPYFIPDRSMVIALQAAALRGVDVRLLFPSRSNHKVVFQAGRSFYEDLLEAGVGIHEYGPGMIHAKTMVVDGRVALVGSANMDLRSFRLNFEVHTVIGGGSTAARLERCFQEDLRVSRRIDLDEFRRRSRLARLAEGAARLLSPLM
jgi:cardiolipin synthase